MSAIGGFLSATALPRSAAEAILTALADGLSRRGPDGCRTVHRGRVGMVHRPFHTGPGSHRPQQPLVAPDGVTLSWDGRLDAPPPADPGSTAGDTERVVAAYRHRGPDFAAHLVGDFALALWDPAPGRLVLACDAFGTRPLFYATGTDGLLLWSSNVTALRAAAPLAGLDGDSLDESWIAGFLNGLRPAGHTVYRHLHSLAPGELLVAEGHRLERRRYWPGDFVRDVRCTDDREYEHRFLELLTEGLRSRLRTGGPVFAELSGGVDSSTVVCLADLLMRRCEVDAPELHTCSYVFDRATSSDERGFLRLVEEHTGRPAHHVSDEDAPLLEGFDAPFTEMPSALGTFRRRYQVTADRMTAAGARVMLSGVGGDDVGISEIHVPPQLADLAAGGRLLALVRALRRWHPRVGLPYPSLLLHGVVLPLLPGAVQARAAREHLPRVPWAGRDFTRRTRLDHRIDDVFPGPAERHLRRPSLRQRCAALRASVVQQVQARYDDQEVLGRQMSYPFLHRPLVEFCLGIPVEQHVRPGETRSLHRRAIAGLVPAAIAARRDKRGPDEAMMRAIAREWPRLQEIFTADALVYQAGYVERRPFLDALNAYRAGLHAQGGSLYRTLELESWLRWRQGTTHRRPAAQSA